MQNYVPIRVSMQNFSSIGTVLVRASHLENCNNHNKNEDEPTDMYEHLDPLCEQGVQKGTMTQLWYITGKEVFTGYYLA